MSPRPFDELDVISFTPCTRASIDSSLLVTPLSITRAELPGMVKLTVRLGRERDGDSLTGSNGTKAAPTMARAMNVTMAVNDDKRRFMRQQKAVCEVSGYGQRIWCCMSNLLDSSMPLSKSNRVSLRSL